MPRRLSASIAPSLLVLLLLACFLKNVDDAAEMAIWTLLKQQKQSATLALCRVGLVSLCKKINQIGTLPRQSVALNVFPFSQGLMLFRSS
jgi:hypothetical protein